MIRLPDNLTAEGFLRRAAELAWTARILADTGHPLETLQERCQRIEELQRRLDRMTGGWPRA